MIGRVLSPLTGLGALAGRLPTDKSVGYYLPSLRDLFRERACLVRRACCLAALIFSCVAASGSPVLAPSAFRHYVEHFNSMEPETVRNLIPNGQAWGWLEANIPWFECPDPEVEEIYYFRWWSYRKHVLHTTNGFLLTEFLVPMRHAGAFNTISCAAGHHLAEGRWLRDQRVLDDYTRFWFRGDGGSPVAHFHKFSSWLPAAIYDRYLVNLDGKLAVELLDDLVKDYRGWEQERQSTNGLFWQYDVMDGMEESISGSRREKNLRPTINSYMFANARAIAAIARLSGRSELAKEYEYRSASLRKLTQSQLWNPAAKFFEVRHPDGTFSGVREEIGFIPWLFEVPEPGYEEAWRQLTDPQGFRAPYGLTTAERRHPAFRSHGCCKCEWDGAVWPFATSQTLGALANLLRDYSQSFVGSKDYFEAFLTYARCHRFDGRPYLGEYLDETTGQWLKGRQERSLYYNHSTFADLLITGLVGLRPRADETIEVHPLLPENGWDWFCLDGVSYHRRTLTIVWDRDGKRYGRGQGLSVLADGKLIARSDKLGKLSGKFP